ncbi:MAG TPA: hypothetical protein VF141_07730 [Chryseolinea sp.]
MRLGQLARKLALRPGDIVEFLAENNIRIADGANARLENDQVTLIMQRFVPGWTEASETEPEPVVEEDIFTELNAGQVSPAELITEEQGQPAGESVVEQVQLDGTNEVIRAPKVELSGLKVVGKIELPEQKKKEDQPKEELAVSEGAKAEEGNDAKRERRESRRQFDGSRRRPQRSEKNPVALQREREEKEAQKKREEQIARDKEKRTQKYRQNYKPAPTTKAVKLVKEDVMEMTPQELAEPPKTIFGKIMRWLTKAS